MFKKRFARKKAWFRGRRGVLPARAIPKSIARVRTDWVTIYNPMGSVSSPQRCNFLVAPYVPLVLPEGAPCLSTFALGVMSNADLSFTYQDDVKIVAMRGEMWLRPVFNNADLCDNTEFLQELTDWSDYAITARGGLFKQRVVGIPPAPDGVVPHPGLDNDWSDAGFLQTFQRTWVTPPIKISQLSFNDGQMVGNCSQVNRAAYTTPATSSGSQPLFNVPAITTNCSQFAFPGGESCYFGGANREFVAPGWKRISLNRRRTIHMHEEDSLQWVVDWSPLEPGGDPVCNWSAPYPRPCAMHIIPYLKIKVQYG